MATESSLDPIFPLPAGTGIPPIKQGYGKDLFENDVHVSAGMTYRSFYVMWEQVERRAAQNYPRYVDGPMDHVAQTWLEAVVWCRQIAHPNIAIEVISEKKAQKIRAKEARKSKTTTSAKGKNPVREEASTGSSTACPKCGATSALKKKHKGEKVWKCAECGHRWPRKTSTRPSKALNGKARSQAPGKKEPRSQKPAGRKASKKRGSRPKQ